MQNKTVLITGCSSGFGLSLTQSLLQQNWRVIATARNLAGAVELKKMKHPLLQIHQLDVTKEKDLQQIKQFIDQELAGKLDCLINNAGFGLSGPFEELTEQQIRQQLEVNVFGVMWMSKVCLPALRNARGRIINVSSILGCLGFPLQSLYVTSKYALEGLSESLYYELQPHGVQVTLIEPGAHHTRFGTNMLLAKLEHENPAYGLQRHNFSRFREKLRVSKGSTSEQLAQCVVKLLQKPSMPLRVRIGRDAKFLYSLKRLLPSRLFNSMMSHFCKRIFLKPYEK